MNEDKPYKVMIVDDDKFLLNMYSIKFSNNKFDVTAVGDGKAAVEKLQEGYEPDVILMDIVMPVMDGLEALSAIRAGTLAKRAAIMVLSNQGQPSDIEKAKAFNVDGYIVKATSIPSEIVTEVQSLLERTKARRESVVQAKDQVQNQTQVQVTAQIPAQVQEVQVPVSAQADVPTTDVQQATNTN